MEGNGKTGYYLLTRGALHTGTSVKAVLPNDDSGPGMDQRRKMEEEWCYGMGYLISAYFDSDSNRALSRHIHEIADVSGNDFMIKNMVPPHLTISFFEARSEDTAKTIFQEIQGKLKPGEIMIPSVGVFFPNVLFAEAVLNAWLFELSSALNAELMLYDEVKVSRYYRPYSWIPHVTLGKTLEEEQMRAAFGYLQKHFCPLTVKAERFGLAKTNPHREILTSAYAVKTKQTNENLG